MSVCSMKVVARYDQELKLDDMSQLQSSCKQNQERPKTRSEIGGRIAGKPRQADLFSKLDDLIPQYPDPLIRLHSANAKAICIWMTGSHRYGGPQSEKELYMGWQ